MDDGVDQGTTASTNFGSSDGASGGATGIAESGGAPTGDPASSGGDSSGGEAPEPEQCDEELEVTLAPSGLPLLQNNPSASVALFLDFDGGEWDGAYYSGYNSNGDPDTFDPGEQEEIIGSWKRVSLYYAMFDVNVTTDDSVRAASDAWGWILITEDESGGLASSSEDALGQNSEPQSYCGASSVRGSDKSRRVAHELGHNFTLHHSGVWDDGEFYKWEDWPRWDGVYGPIMGGGGKGERNGWASGHHEKDPDEIQDEMEIIRERLMDVGESATGWHADDFAEATPASLCLGTNDELYRTATLEQPDDVDVFHFDWAGGDVTIDAGAIDVSAALVLVDLVDDKGDLVGGLGENPALPAGRYRLRVTSQGDYGAIGTYEIRVHP